MNIAIGGISTGKCGCCQMEYDDALLVADADYGLVCVGCDLFLMEQAVELACET